MSQLIGGWRKAWNQGGSPDSGAPIEEFPFLIMQLAGYQCPPSPWCGPGAFVELRTAQQKIAESVAGTGIATAIDIGDAQNVHPTNKQDVGRRLALVALKQVYRQNVVASGPKLVNANFELGKVTLEFDSGGVGQRLVVKNAEASGFELAGGDGKFVPARMSEIRGNIIILTSEAVKNPRGVRYAWADYPLVTIYNSNGLPALPFIRGTK